MIKPRTLPRSEAWGGWKPDVQVPVDLHHQQEALQHSHDVITDIRQ